MDRKVKDYQTADTLGMSASELIVKVYDGAIFNIKEAIDSYKQENFQAGYELLEKSKRFIVHLYTTLDEEKGGDIAEKLSKLYAFLMERMNFAQATKDITTLEDSVSILNNIRDGWVQLAEQSKLKPNNEITDNSKVKTPGSLSVSA